jgi:Cof subfamily protein (haloacid dehalogenase superfamily)
MIQLVIADVDGTLVTPDKELTPRARDAVRKLNAAGIRFAVTSGRPPRGMEMLIEPLSLAMPVAGFNGGMFVKPDMTPIEEKTLDPKLVGPIVQAILDHKLDAWIYQGNDWLLRDPSAPHAAREQHTVQFPPTVVKGLDGHDTRVVKIVGVGDDFAAVEAAERHLREQFGASVSAARSQPYYVDVTHPQANKGDVVRRLSQWLSIPMERIATIGDMPNDVLMFSLGGLSIAMGNASADVQRAARRVTSSNKEEGFAEAMERFVLAGG